MLLAVARDPSTCVTVIVTTTDPFPETMVVIMLGVPVLFVERVELEVERS